MTSFVPEFGSAVVELPASLVQTLAAFPEVTSISPLPKLKTMGRENREIVQSQGVFAHRVDVAQSRVTNATGHGIKVGVLSDSVDFLAQVQQTGNLPQSVAVLGDPVLGAGEGTAMLELVHDVAPDADLYFASAYPTEATFAANIIALAAAGCRVIVDDALYFSEPVYSDGPVAQAVDKVVSEGVVYLSAASNGGNTLSYSSQVWEGNYTPVNDPAFSDLYEDVNLFPGAHYLILTLETEGTVDITLHWADLMNDPQTDYDLYLADSEGQVIGVSANSGMALEEIQTILAPGNYFLYVARFDGPPRMFSVRLCKFAALDDVPYFPFHPSSSTKRSFDEFDSPPHTFNKWVHFWARRGSRRHGDRSHRVCGPRELLLSLDNLPVRPLSRRILKPGAQASFLQLRQHAYHAERLHNHWGSCPPEARVSRI